MCGRYYVNESIKEKLYNIVDEYEDIQEDYNITPGRKISVVIKEDHLLCKQMKWGYTLSMSNSLVINARSETIYEKKMFKEDIMQRRCLIPATGFYEWDHLKHQISFENDEDILWLAGIYNKQGEVVIVTMLANQVMKPIHSRMPLIIHQQDIYTWLSDTYEPLLTKQYDDLQIVSGYIQQSLFDD